MADNFQFSNNASALLAGNITDADTALAVETGGGALFPNPTGSQEFRAALQDATGALEIIKVTARSGDNMTVERGQEGTTAQSWSLGVTRLELRLTEETMEEFLQKNGGTMTGDLDLNENNLVDARVNGANTVIEEGQIVGVPLRGAEDDSSNEVAVPNDGTRATAGGSPLLTQADLASNGGLNFLPVGTIVMWYGTLGSLPTGWQNCDGTNGSPDLRDKFPRGAGNSIALGGTGGAATASGNTGSSGAHTHPGSTAAAHALTVAELPAHTHRLWANNDSTSTGAHGLSSGVGRTVAGYSNSGGSEAYTTNTGTGAQAVESTGSGNGHTHSLSVASDGAHTHSLSSVSVIPPYVGVYFIMKVS